MLFPNAKIDPLLAGESSIHHATRPALPPAPAVEDPEKDARRAEEVRWPGLPCVL